MKELLEQWLNLEPERCRQKELAQVQLRGWWRDIATTSNTGLSHALVQAAVQEAIEARGWSWAVDGLKPNEERGWLYIADINEQGLRMGDSPAVALLTAYLQALKATQEVPA